VFPAPSPSGPRGVEKGPPPPLPYVRQIEGPIDELPSHGRHAVRIYDRQQEKDVFIAATGEVKKRDEPDRDLAEKASAAHAEFDED